VQVPKKYVPHFKAGKELRERVDSLIFADDPEGQPMPLKPRVSQATGG